MLGLPGLPCRRPRTPLQPRSFSRSARAIMAQCKVAPGILVRKVIFLGSDCPSAGRPDVPKYFYKTLSAGADRSIGLARSNAADRAVVVRAVCSRKRADGRDSVVRKADRNLRGERLSSGSDRPASRHRVTAVSSLMRTDRDDPREPVTGGADDSRRIYIIPKTRGRPDAQKPASANLCSYGGLAAKNIFLALSKGPHALPRRGDQSSVRSFRAA